MAKPSDWFEERIAQSQDFRRVPCASLVGVVGLRTHDDAKQRHKAMIWGMYVRREARQYGIGKRLLDAAVAYASDHVEQLQLAVVTENEAARRLYAKAGFIEYGHQINALKQRRTLLRRRPDGEIPRVPGAMRCRHPCRSRLSAKA